MNAPIRSIRDFDLRGRRVFIRLDLNVPLSQTLEVEDDLRIREAIPTIQFAIENGSKVILASHLGRPKGKRKTEFSLEPVAKKLAALIGQEVSLADDCIGEGIELMTKSLKDSQVLLLQNLRFHEEEESNDQQFVGRLSRLLDVYISDAFGTTHRKHASTYGLPKAVSEKGMGFLIEKELKYLDPLINSPQKPFYTLLGGSKVSDKIKTIRSLMKNVDGLLIGGAMANAFLLAEKYPLPEKAKQPTSEDIDLARALIIETKKKNIPLLIPRDLKDGFDIGPTTIREFCEFLSEGKTVFWNGPLGWFENPEYAEGTFQVAKALASIEAIKVIGGGDTVSAVRKSGFSERFDHLSTGGGAVLEYLEGNGLPGIEVLRMNGSP